jgi:sialic acid synthase SpsE
MRLAELLADKALGRGAPRQPCLIAEAGVNHEGSLDTAKRLIEEAHEGGADVIKFQTYRAETLASKDSPAYWDTTKEKTRSQYELFKKHDKFWKNEFETLKKHCDKVGIEFLSTPFDLESAGFLNDMMAVFKISSSDITNKPFIQHIASFGKPILLSTGASNMDEIEEAVGWIRPYGNKMALLHCVLNYPTSDKDANLAMIRDLAARFQDAIIGYSDHTLPRDMKTLETAVILGAALLEKHFTHDKTLPGNDHYHAADKKDFQVFRKGMKRIIELLGSPDKMSLSVEEPARQHARRSLVASRRIPKGDRIGPEQLTWKRPAHGISPRDIDRVIGRIAAADIEEDTPLKWEMIAD